MKFVPMAEILRPAWQAGYAVPSFCAWNAEVTETILQVATDLQSPVILMSGPGEFPLNPPDTMARISRAVAEKFSVPTALHLDHGDSPQIVETCLKAGYTSVMLDYSTRSFAENAGALREIVAMARPYGATVEGEIGAVGRVDDLTTESGKESRLTDPAEAARYVETSGVHALAVSIGNAHGLYAKLPVFDFDRLSAIRKSVPVPLVLHGGSGTQPEYIRKAAAMGMAKINVASELCKAFRESYAENVPGKTGWLPALMGATKAAIAQVVEKWLMLSGAAGKARMGG